MAEAHRGTGQPPAPSGKVRPVTEVDLLVGRLHQHYETGGDSDFHAAAIAITALQSLNATLRQQYADGLAAWKANNAHFSSRADAGDALLREARWFVNAASVVSPAARELLQEIDARLKERS